jgi:hypothetical protein
MHTYILALILKLGIEKNFSMQYAGIKTKYRGGGGGGGQITYA